MNASQQRRLAARRPRAVARVVNITPAVALFAAATFAFSFSLILRVLL